MPAADLEGQYDLSITSEAFSVTRFSDGQGNESEGLNDRAPVLCDAVHKVDSTLMFTES